MKNVELHSLGLMELDAEEKLYASGGYAPGDVVSTQTLHHSGEGAK